MKAPGLVRDRALWAAVRLRMEAGNEKHAPDGRRRHRRWSAFKAALWAFSVGLRLLGLHARGVRNALDLELRELTLSLPALPAAFEGYRIVQLSDLHLDALPGFGAHLARFLRSCGAAPDLIVLTGDYRFRVHGSTEGVRRGLSELAPALVAPDGVLAVLGNHDTVDMLPLLEGAGARVLVNETVSLARGGERLYVTGVDDAHYYFTEQASAALAEVRNGFRIALAHSPELVEHAATAGIDLYLTGHTHGGQVCLPGGIPIITHSLALRRFAVGRWSHGGMIGYTSRGAGVSGVPVRFNCRGEVTLLTLRRPSAG